MNKPKLLPQWGWLLLLGAVLWVALLAGRPAAQAAPTLHLQVAERLDVDEPAGYAPAAPQQDSRALPGNWVAVSLPHTQPSQLLAQASAEAKLSKRSSWYRIRVPAGLAAGQPLALYAARTKSDGPIALYVDGQLQRQWQLDGPAWYWAPLFVPLPGAGAPKELLLRLQHLRATPTALASVWLGPAEAMQWRYRWRDWLQVELPALSAAALLALGFFALAVWLRRRHEPAYLLCFALALAAGFRSLHFRVELLERPDWFAWATLNSLYWTLCLAHAFQCGLQASPARWLTRSLHACSVGVALLSLPLLAQMENSAQLTPLLYLPVLPLALAMAWSGFTRAGQHATEGLAIAACIAIAILFGTWDWLLQSNFIGPEGWYLGPYIPLLIFVTFCGLLLRRYITALVQVEQSNARLEERLVARTRELEASHASLRELARRQTQQQERQRLMQEMHAGLGGALREAVGALQQGRPQQQPPAELLRACIEDLSLTVDSLQAGQTDLLLLLGNLRYRLQARLQLSGLRLLWQVGELPALPWLDPRCALQILRLLQQALLLLARLGPGEVTVRTRAAEHGVLLLLGWPGTAPAPATMNALGDLPALARQLDGHLSADAQGLTLWLPLQRAAAS